jgi:hypothetical protein
MPEIPKPTKYSEAVTTITPVTKKNWAGSSEKASEKAGGKSK